jgi:hypothetical protein
MDTSVGAAVVLLACASAGVASALDNGFTAPPMGWSALYGAPFSLVNETNVQAAAAGLAASGLPKLGYKYINLDDWYATRNETTGKIEGGPNFPSGMRATSDFVHAHGLLFGVYSAGSQRTCGNYSASLWREAADADTFANDWQIDMLKYDQCDYTNGLASRTRYLAMSRALNATGRQIFYSVEGWAGTSQTQGDWGPEYANMWRTGNDIWPKWDLCILNNLYTTNAMAQYMVPGKAWNDPDMLQPPGYIPGTTSVPGLTLEESRAQFVLWAAMKAPLILGVNHAQLATLPTAFPDYFAVIANPEVIAVDQDASPPAVLVAQMPSQQQQQQAATTPLNVTLQLCDAGRVDQKWSQPSAGVIQARGTSLCITTAAGSSVAAFAAPCSAGAAAQQQFDLAPTSALQSAARFTSDPMQCLASTILPDGTPALSNAPCVMPQGVTTPSFNEGTVGSQTLLWDSLTSQILSGSTGLCVTLGQPNLPPAGRPWTTNNGTLHHEVWSGPLSNGKQVVVVLFNKGDFNETVAAARELLELPAACAASSPSCPVRDLLARQDLPALPAGAPLTATVPSHGVQMFLVG